MSISTRPRTKRVRYGPHSNGRLMSPAEFDRAKANAFEPHLRYEVVEGVLIVSPPAGAGQADPNDELGHWLRSYRDAHPNGSALDGTFGEGYVHMPTSRRIADRVIWTGLGRLPDPATDVPTIAVEFVSSRTRDRERDYVEKRREYLAVGVQEYWIIDRFSRRMTVARQGAAGSEPSEIVVPADGIYTTPLLPGFELPLARLLELADNWSRAKKRKQPDAK